MKRLVRLAAVVVFSLVSASAAHAQYVNVTLTEFKVDMTKDTMPAGRFTFQVKNAGTMSHGFRVKGDSVDKGTSDLAKGESATLTISLRPGTYELYCPMSENSHKMAGMTRKLVIVPAAPKAP